MNELFVGRGTPTLNALAGGRKEERRELDSEEFKASELCSRKLWQLVNERDGDEVAEAQLQQAVQELTARRHYLAELARIGNLGCSINNA